MRMRVKKPDQECLKREEMESERREGGGKVVSIVTCSCASLG